jgi:hypothetical protein
VLCEYSGLYPDMDNAPGPKFASPGSGTNSTHISFTDADDAFWL